MSNVFYSQGMNRYAYVYNSPINFVDPSGHVTCTDDGYCPGSNNNNYWKKVFKEIETDYEIELDDSFNSREKLAAATAVILTGAKFASTRDQGESGAEAFTAIFDPITFVKTDNYNIGCHFQDTRTVSCGGFDYQQFQSGVNNIVHELGHILNDLAGGQPNNFGWLYADPIVRDNLLRPVYDTELIYWQFDRKYDPTTPEGRVASGGEMFGDMIVAWVFDAWNQNPRNTNLVNQVKQDMTTDMKIWFGN